MEDYSKVTYGMKHRLTLVQATGVKTGKVNLTKVAWLMPRVIPSDSKRDELYQMIADESEFDVGYRRRQCNVADIAKNVISFDWRLGVRTAPEKPSHILVALQEGK